MIVTVIKDNESVIYNNKIYSKGQSFEVDDIIGKSLMERGYVAMDVTDSDADVETSPDDEGNTDDTSTNASLEEASYTELKKMAASMGLNANGKREELIARIIEAEQGAEQESDEEEALDDLPNTDMP